jgi:peptide/nickel transport system substrate-binding protein
MTDHTKRSHTLTRRGFLAASALAAAGAAGAAIVGCGEGKQRASSRPSSSPTPLAERVPVGVRGGVLRAYNFDALSYDSLDPHLTQMGPIVDIHSLIYSRLYRYDDQRAGTIVPDLAAAMPEQPDETTYIIRLRDGVTFHDTPAFRAAHSRAPGRTLDASDVKYSIERQLNAAGANGPRFFRASQWRAVQGIEARDAQTVVITTTKPVAPFVSFLAGRHAFIVPKEVPGKGDVIADPADAIGTGPFILNTLKAGVIAGLGRNPNWFARDDESAGIGAGRPFLDGYEAYFSPEEDAFQRAAFDRHIVDTTGFVDPSALDTARKTNLSDIRLEETDSGNFIALRLLLDRGLFKDDRVRRSLHLALDRPALLELLYPDMDGRPSARLSGPIAPAVDRFALSPDDLARRAGYRTGTSREEDIANARQLWSAATSGAPTPLAIAFGGKPGIIPARAMDAVKRQLEEALPGLTVTTSADPSGYAVIASSLIRNLEGATDGIVPATFLLEDGGVDLDDWLFPHFRSGGSMNTYRLQDAQLDAMLDKQRAEFDADARAKLGRDIQDYLLSNVNARLEIGAPIERRLTWGFVRNSSIPLAYGSAQSLADVWIDTAHPAWAPRPT